ncbi:MAG: Rieske 2Fe-2S domain-containing protein [Anaerolineales bacterium]|jgi:cytochrome b6-f complex iron-sulfur subunit
MTEAVAQSPEASPERVPLNRREFLYYLWGVSMAVFLAGGGGVTLWFMLPRFREGEFGGVFSVSVGDLPPEDSAPKEFTEGRFWLSNIGPQSLDDTRRPGDYPLNQGIRAIYKVCTHLGCLYKWVPNNDRFECPCHGSKFLQTGIRIDGPARRNLDVFPIEVVDSDGNVLARTEPMLTSGGSQTGDLTVDGSPVPVPPEAVELRIDTGRTIVGAPNSQPGGGI